MQKTLLRWAGSKKKLLPHLIKYYSKGFDRYFEPFVGSGQLFFNLPLERAILSDINVGLISMYNALKSDYIKVYDYLTQFPQTKEFYYVLRDGEQVETDKYYTAARFIFLNTFCFNGLYRTNLAGKFNVPYSASSGKLINLDELEKLAAYLHKGEFIVGDFQTVVEDQCGNNDFVYLDPPYAVRNKRIFNQYSPDTFGLNDLLRLKDLIRDIDSRGAKFVLSYASCEEAVLLSEGWHCEKVQTIRNISGFAKHRKTEQEVLITNIYQ